MRLIFIFFLVWSAAFGQSVPGAFTALTPGHENAFAPTTTLLTGFPTVSCSPGPTCPAQGYQGGQYFPPSATYPNGLACFIPWQYQSATPIGTLLCYKGGPPGTGTFHCTSAGSCASNWDFFDMTTLTPFCPATFTCPGAANQTGFTCQGVQDASGNMYLPPGFDVAAHPVFMMVSPTASGGITNSANYSYFSAPNNGTSTQLGTGYGWCQVVFDGRYITYAPTGAGSFGSNTNVVRYDTTGAGGFVLANFDHVDISAFDANAGSYLAATYDGYRYIYYLPVENGGAGNGDMARFDTTCGGGLTSSSCWSFFSAANLGKGGSNPGATGVGNLQSLQANAYYVGGQIVWDPAGANEYMIMAPFATNPAGLAQGGQTLFSIVSMVKTGSCSSPVAGSQSCSGTFTATNIFNSTSTWTYYDLAGLAANQEWLAAGYSWPPLFGSFSYGGTALANQLAVGGFQLTWLNTHTASDPIVGLVADFGAFYARFHLGLGKTIYDPTAWDLFPRPASQVNGFMGGAYDATNQCLYPSGPSASPNPSTFQICVI